MDINKIIETYNLKLEIKNDQPTGRIMVLNTAYAKKAGIDPIKQNRPSVYQELLSRRQASLDAVKSRAEAIDGIEGLKEIRAAIDDLEAWNREFERSFDDVGGLGVRPKPKYDLDDMCQRYPRAAAYLKAESWEYSGHYVKAGCGKTAKEKIINGEDYGQAIAEMEKEWSDYCQEHIWD